MNLNQLNAAHAIPQHIYFAAGPNGLVQAHINNANATAAVSLLGGHLLTFQPHGKHPYLWMSELAEFAEGKAIRGGIPVIWPWFGGHPGDAALPSHGLVRSRLWQVVSTSALEDDATKLVLAIESNAETLAIWPHPFRLTATFVLGEKLSVTLTAYNTGDTPFSWSGALHSYFHISHIDSAQVAALDNVTYQDKVHGGTPVQDGTIHFTEETDRVYLTTTERVEINDQASRSQLILDQTNHDSVVVWNPWTTAPKADLSAEAYTQFVCVETAFGAGAVSAETLPILNADESYEFSVTIHD